MYLDPADGLLGLHHANVLGGVPLRQQLSGAQVVCSKDDPINQVFWFARPGHLGNSGKKRADEQFCCSETTGLQGEQARGGVSTSWKGAAGKC